MGIRVEIIVSFMTLCGIDSLYRSYEFTLGIHRALDQTYLDLAAAVEINQIQGRFMDNR